MTDVTLYHNPKCGTSRTVLALLRERGIEPRIVEYLQTPPGRDELEAILAAGGLRARDLLRAKEAACAELGLDDPAKGDAELIDAMLAHPVLINRPIVVTPAGARLCRPAETVLALLPA